MRLMYIDQTSRIVDVVGYPRGQSYDRLLSKHAAYSNHVTAG